MDSIKHIKGNKRKVIKSILRLHGLDNTEKIGWYRFHEIKRSLSILKNPISQDQNLNKYLTELMKLNIIEREKFHFIDKRGRESDPYYYRLRINIYYEYLKKNYKKEKKRIIERYYNYWYNIWYLEFMFDALNIDKEKIERNIYKYFLDISKKSIESLEMDQVTTSNKTRKIVNVAFSNFQEIQKISNPLRKGRK